MDKNALTEKRRETVISLLKGMQIRRGTNEGFDKDDVYGTVLRAKGMVDGGNGTWVYFDYVPGEAQVRTGAAMVTGKLCVIGAELNQDALTRLFA